MITLHHLNNSRSQRLLWLLEELGLEYEIKYYQRNPKTMLAPPELEQIHPLGKAPVITDGEVVMAESGAIIEYLLDRYGHAYVPDKTTPAHGQYLYWLHFAEGSLMPPLLLTLVLDKIRTSPMPFFAKPIAKGISQQVGSAFVQPNVKRLLTFIDQHLAQHSWFAGDALSGADFQMSFPLEAAQARGLIDRRYPNIEGYLRRIHALPAYQRGLEKGGPYDYAA
ncbi:MAG: glutathione S-transferase [Reinekea sp.]|nr:glutathione S-transferase [Reinekea sp.]